MFWIYLAGVFTIPAMLFLVGLWGWLSERGEILYCRCGKTFGYHLPDDERFRHAVDHPDEDQPPINTLNRVTRIKHRWHKLSGEHERLMRHG